MGESPRILGARLAPRGSTCTLDHASGQEVGAHGWRGQEVGCLGSSGGGLSPRSRTTARISSAGAEIDIPGVDYFSLIYCFSFVLFTALSASL